MSSLLTANVLTQSLDEFVKQEIVEQGFSGESEYYEKLAEAEHRQRIWDYYEQEVKRGLESGPPIPDSPEFWDGIREEVRQRVQSKKRGSVVAL